MDIHMSDGTTKKNCVLIVINCDGYNEERGYRLGWTDNDGATYTPARGLVTSNPFHTEREAVAFGVRNWGQMAKRLTNRGLVTVRT